MKKIQFLFSAVCAAVLTATISVSAQTGDSGYATVVRVEGVASYSLGDGKWTPLVAGKILPVGAVIRTEHNGVVDVVLGKDIGLPQNSWQSRWTPSHVAPAPDESVRGMVSYRPAAEQNVVRLSPDTTLGLDKLTVIDTGADTVSDTELNLKQGKIFASVKKLTGASQYLIKLPNGIAGVRGTQFSIDISGATTVYHSSGGGVVLSLVGVSGLPTTTVVGAGFSFDPSSGQLTILPGDEQNFLERLFSALQTVYAPVSYVTRDGTTTCYISPVHGVGGGSSPPPEIIPPTPQSLPISPLSPPAP